MSRILELDRIWWTVFELRTVTERSLIDFMAVLSLPIVAYLMSVLISPDFDRQKTIDLRTGYYQHRRWFYGLFFLLPTLSFTTKGVIYGTITYDADALFRAGFLLAALVGFFSARKPLHQVLPPLVLAGFVAYIGVLYLEIP